MTVATAITQKSIISSRTFGEFNRYKLTVFLTRDNTIEFFLSDVDAGKAGVPAVIGQADALSQCLSVLPDKGAEFMALKPTKANQIAINLEKTLVRVVKFESRGVLVECLGTRQRWHAPLEKLVLV